MNKIIACWNIEGITVTVYLDAEGIEAVAGEICKRLRVEIRDGGKEGEKKKAEQHE
jgi:hypothetical protein